MIAPMTFTTLALAAAPVLADMHHHAGFMRARHVRRRLDTLYRRKTLGWGDSTTIPSTVAQGSDDASCTCWHQVAAGEVCLGLIDKSSAGFTLEKFFQLNPSLNNDCSNLVTGLSYCVDTGANVEPSGSSVNKAASSVAGLVAAKYVQPSVSASASASASASSCTANEDDDEEDYEEDAASSSSYVAPSPTVQNVKAAVIAPTTSPTTWAQQTTWASPSSTWTPPSSTQAQATQGSSSNSGGALGQLLTGTATFYYQKGVAGSCGTVSSDDDYVAAVFSGARYGESNCGRMARVTNTKTGASIEVKVMDTCPTCTDQSHIDLSTAAFAALANNDMGLGVLQTTWQYIS